MHFYMPTSIAVDLLRTPGGLKWAIPLALIATPAYLGAMAVCAQFALRPGLGWFHVLVLLFFCYAASRVMPTYVWLSRETST
jgi:hypothetical protein